MNSIKNAIVTVTLLAVGYGSYVILKDPDNGRFPQDVLDAQSSAMSSRDSTDLLVDGLPEVEVTVESAAEREFDNASGLSTFAHDQPSESPAQVEDPLLQAASELPPLPELAPPGNSPKLTAQLNGPARSRASRFDTPLEAETEISEAPSRTELFAPLADLPHGNPAPDLMPLQSEVEPPVAAATPTDPVEAASIASPDSFSHGEAASEITSDIPAADVAADRVSNPFASPIGSGDSTSPISTEIELPIVEAELEEPLASSLPPINRSVGPIPPEHESDGSLTFEEIWADVQESLRAKDLAKALQTLTPWSSDSGLSQEQNIRCMRLLDELAGTVIYSRDSYLEPAYEVQAGETLDEIAAKYSVPQELLAKINGIAPPFALSTGEQIKVVRGPFRATVSLANHEMTLFVGTHYAGRFPVKIGRDLPPEAAFYEVAEKSLGRSYFDRRAGREILKGSDGNRYGERWLGLRGEHITTAHSVGIHGRPIHASEQDTANTGSISLDPLDVEDVYSILSVGSRVEVRQ